MTVTYGFYDSLSGDRKYNADQMSRLFEGIITDGVFQSIGNALSVVPKTGMTVTVKSGRAWFYNTWTNNDGDLDLTLDASVVGLSRIDTIILEVDKNVATRANSIKILKGTGTAGTPVAPTLTNTSTVKQYGLADILVGSGVTSINAGNITNRVGTVGTPFITGIIQSASVDQVMAQYTYLFNTWFTDLQNQLDTNQATNLQNQINDLEAGWINPGETWTYASADAPTFTFTISGDKTTVYSKGMRVKLTQTTVKYFIITNVAYSSPNTTITVYGGTDYTLTNAAISANRYSFDKAPYGFPLDPTKWTISLVQGANVTQTSPVVSQYYNLGSLSMVMPIGAWVPRLQATGYIDRGSAATMIMQFGISTSPTSVSDTSLTGEWAIGSIALLQQPFALAPMPIVRTSKATYYFIGMTGTAGVSNLIAKNIVVQFVCAYL